MRSWQSLRLCSCFSYSLHIILLPVTRETVSRSLIKGWRCSAFLGATLFCRSLPPVHPFVDVDPTDSLWAPGPNQGCSAGGVKKTWRFEQTKRGSLRYRGPLVRWNERRRRACQIILFFFFFFFFFFCCYFQSCYALLLFSKQGGSRWKKYFCLRRLRGWYTNDLHVGLTEMRPAHHGQTGNPARAWWYRAGPFRFCCIRVLVMKSSFGILKNK